MRKHVLQYTVFVEWLLCKQARAHLCGMRYNDVHTVVVTDHD